MIVHELAKDAKEDSLCYFYFWYYGIFHRIQSFSLLKSKGVISYCCFLIWNGYVKPRFMIYGRELPGYPYNLRAKLTRCLVAARRNAARKFNLRFLNHSPLAISVLGQAANDLIRDTLWKELPDSYDDSLAEYRQRIYEYVYTRYKMAA